MRPVLTKVVVNSAAIRNIPATKLNPVVLILFIMTYIVLLPYIVLVHCFIKVLLLQGVWNLHPNDMKSSN